jgi:hypothetical protein
MRTTIIFLAGIALLAQKTSVADTAARLSGTWTINLTLSPTFKPSGRSGAGRSGGAAFAVAGLAVQRGRNSPSPGSEPTPSAPGDLTPTERAELSAIQQVEQLAPAMTVKATAETVSFTDQRGDQTCAINDKAAKLDMFGAKVGVKCRWNKESLQQEFSTTRNKLTRAWTVDDTGHLVVKTRVEGLAQRAVEATAVYDRGSS